MKYFAGKALCVGIMTAAASMVLVGAADAAQPGVAPQQIPVHVYGSCGDVLNPSTNYSHAHWTVSCRNGEVTVDGYVKHDGGAYRPCAAVKATFEGQINEKSGDSCGSAGGAFSGPTINFKWTHPGSIADAYLFDR